MDDHNQVPDFLRELLIEGARDMVQQTGYVWGTLSESILFDTGGRVIAAELPDGRAIAPFSDDDREGIEAAQLYLNEHGYTATILEGPLPEAVNPDHNDGTTWLVITKN